VRTWRDASRVVPEGAIELDVRSQCRHWVGDEIGSYTLDDWNDLSLRRKTCAASGPLKPVPDRRSPAVAAFAHSEFRRRPA
jgi:hypothetical protein